MNERIIRTGIMLDVETFFGNSGMGVIGVIISYRIKEIFYKVNWYGGENEVFLVRAGRKDDALGIIGRMVWDAESGDVIDPYDDSTVLKYVGENFIRAGMHHNTIGVLGRKVPNAKLFNYFINQPELGGVFL